MAIPCVRMKFYEKKNHPNVKKSSKKIAQKNVKNFPKKRKILPKKNVKNCPKKRKKSSK